MLRTLRAGLAERLKRAVASPASRVTYDGCSSTRIIEYVFNLKLA